MKYYKCRKEDIGKRVSDLLSEIGEILPDTPCGGRGSCGKCRMRLGGMLSEADSTEKQLLGDDYDRGFRLICLARIMGDFEYETQDKLDAEIQLDFSAMNIAPSEEEGYVLAVDIGTTTVAVYLCNRTNGKIEAKSSFVNPQRKHGADVISRLVFAKEGGLDILCSEIGKALSDIVLSFEKRVEYAVICGNTAMEHFLCGEDPSGIAKLPFTPTTLFGREYSFDFCESVYLAPCIAAYVGGDITMGALVCSLDRCEGLTLYIDIGTNGEIVLADSERILCCAAAAGPAFEGGNIDCGMIASEGAISRVYNDKGNLAFETIGEKKPMGICGSGLIDAVSVFLELEYMDETGRLDTDKIYFTDSVFVSQKDIRALQSAKAAIAAGVHTLCHEMGCDVSDIERVMIAGGFGSHINADSARRIGLIPYGCEAKIEFMGNCAGMGAVYFALDRAENNRLEAFCKRMEYVELSGNKKFNEYYIDEMYFEE